MSTSTEVPGRGADVRPSPAALSGAGRPIWMTVAFACAAMLVAYLPFSAVNGVLGTIGAATGAGTGDLQWVTDALTVALVGAVLSAGVLGDLYGRKRIALAGLGLTVVSTVTGRPRRPAAGRSRPGRRRT